MSAVNYQVKVVSDDAELVAVSEMVAASYSPSMQCTAPATFPSLATLRRAPHVYAAYADGQLVAAAVISERGQGGRFNGVAEHMADAGIAIMRAVHADFGAFWGHIENPGLRNALVAASGGQLVTDGTRISWAGSA